MEDPFIETNPHILELNPIITSNLGFGVLDTCVSIGLIEVEEASASEPSHPPYSSSLSSLTSSFKDTLQNVPLQSFYGLSGIGFPIPTEKLVHPKKLEPDQVAYAIPSLRKSSKGALIWGLTSKDLSMVKTHSVRKGKKGKGVDLLHVSSATPIITSSNSNSRALTGIKSLSRLRYNLYIN